MSKGPILLKEMIPEIGQMDKEYTNVLSELEDEKKKDTPDPAKMKELQTKAKEVNLKLIESLRKQRSADTEKLIAAKKGDNVYLLSKNTLYCIDRLIGKLLWRKRLGFVASASPFAVKSYVFIPSAVKDRVYILDVAREGEEAAYCKAESEQADGNDITTQPFYEDPNIFFVSHNGRIYSFNAPRNDFNWIYQTNGAIKAPPTVYFYRWGGEKDWKKFLFIGSFDYGLYAFDADSGGLMWKYECGGVFKTPAIAKDGTVYVKTENGYLFALNVRPMHMDKGFATGEKRNGELRWKLPLGERFLVKGKERVYVLGPEKEIYAINEMSGEIRGRYKTDILKFLVTNTIDDIFYVATENGYIFALKESAKEF